ncbi:hypothetical protein [Oscillatoria sp. FACHB-1406]|uniref:slr1601 family putative cell division protein n=1 Tax=Oscillatoria sp. FACHB-1406 TaxID=2692846 RepID=UPI0016864A17|nr:hypothetical protein [Oscillatoria sp. FACHB-1406]MBD2578920.1 hypothetical protein [Oscillatoria sp. FACHB-1406]
MSALQKRTEPFNPERRPARSLQSQRNRRSSYRAIAIENLVKVLVNGVLSVAAITALSDLLPYLQSNRVKLREIRVQVKETQLQVDELRNKFSNTFDPHQANSVMQEQSARIARNQRRVVWLEKKTENNE